MNFSSSNICMRRVSLGLEYFKLGNSASFGVGYRRLPVNLDGHRPLPSSWISGILRRLPKARRLDFNLVGDHCNEQRMSDDDGWYTLLAHQYGYTTSLSKCLFFPKDMKCSGMPHLSHQAPGSSPEGLSVKIPQNRPQISKIFGLK